MQASVGSRQEIGSTTYVEVTFTNEGSSCWISGFPQVLFASGGATVSEAARDGEDPGNVYTIPEGGRVGVTLTAESVDGVDGCTAGERDGFLASCFYDVEADSLNQLGEVAHPQRHTEATASARVAPTSPVRARADRGHPR